MTTTYPETPDIHSKQKLATVDPILRENGRKADVFPLSFAQRRLWFLDKLQPGSATYNVPTVVRMAGPIQLDALRKGLTAAVARHDALRATFSAGGEEPVQKIAPAAEVPLDLIDLSQVPIGRRESEADRIVREKVRVSFDL